jgi:glycosyltransferase involved in cell wall biosynthesis
MRVACLATQGQGSRDEARIVELLAELDPVTFAFDASAKLRSATRFLRQARAQSPDIVVMEGTGVAGGLAVLLARHWFGVPFVFSSGDAVGPFVARQYLRVGPVAHLYERLLFRSCAGFIGWTPYFVGRAIHLGARRACTAPGWAAVVRSTADPAQVRREFGIPQAAIVFGIAGSLNWTDKVGYCYGLEMVRAVQATDRTDVAVLIVGDGSGRQRLEERAGGDPRIFFTGRISSERVMDLYAAMDIASLPQSVDGVGAYRYSTKLAEYVEAGLPVVTNQIPCGYDLALAWSWRLPGEAPWDELYVRALADLMAVCSRQDVAAHRDAIDAGLTFSRDRQRSIVSAFVRECVA